MRISLENIRDLSPIGEGPFGDWGAWPFGGNTSYSILWSYTTGPLPYFEFYINSEGQWFMAAMMPITEGADEYTGYRFTSQVDWDVWTGEDSSTYDDETLFAVFATGIIWWDDPVTFPLWKRYCESFYTPKESL